jgi:hypothetical protein
MSQIHNIGLRIAAPDSEPDPEPDLNLDRDLKVSGTDPRIRIPDPYQNVTDLQHTGPRNAVLDPVAIIVITIFPSSHRKKRVLIRHFLCPKGV